MACMGYRRGTCRVLVWQPEGNKLPYILESNLHSFYGFRGLKIQMRIIIACGFDMRSRARFWKNDRAAVRAVKTM